MNRKKVFLLLVSLVFMISLVSGAVSAQEREGLGGLAETMEKIFGFIPEAVTMEKLISGDRLALFYSKLLIWILLFATIYFGSTFVFKEKNNIAVVVSFIIALISVLAIPNTIVVNIFQTYSLAAGFAIWFVPVVAGLFLAHKIQNKAVKALFYLVLIFLLFSIDKTISNAYGTEWGGVRWFEFFRLLLVVVIIAFLWNLFTMFGGTSEWAGQAAGNAGRGIWDWMTGGGAGAAGGAGGPTGGPAGGGGTGGGAAGGTTTPINVAQLRLEENLLKLLRQIGRKLDDIKKNNNPADAKNFITQAMALITANIRNLDNLMRKEIRQNQLNQLKRYGFSPKYHTLVRNERNLIVQLNNLVQRLSNHLNSGNYPEAKKEVNFAVQIVSALEKINGREIKIT